MTREFDHTTLGQRVRFGSGGARRLLEDEVSSRDAQRAMVIAAPFEKDIADRLTSGLTDALRFDEVVQHVPIEVAERARAAATAADVDLIVSIGGGSTTGLAKAIAMTTGIPIVAIPTTYAGSEATNVWGLTEASRKTTGVDDRVLPGTVIYDAELTLTLPVELSVASGLNAIAHCVDSLWAPRTDPINQALAGEGIRALAAGLRGIHADLHDLEAREQALYGTYLAAVAFASAGSGMHHKICHVLGGTYNLPHAQTHAVILPYVTAFNVPFDPQAAARLEAAFDAADAIDGMEALRLDLEAPRALRDFGFDQDSIPEAARLCLEAIPESNPAPVDQAGLEALLLAAWAGEPSAAATKGAGR
ncbi:maleylacetate reductase [Naasia lichenicola]|uniref:Maleylacetate reductase n=1 Tax=Naasia lichenicola TaxID=2565933 RepID=A0A4S4FMZ4_9MICO|nr:maleylacetate reductase [Naasia lichenicola]THG31564.1 maleylacetate reductase [Naasia lichenicola]